MRLLLGSEFGRSLARQREVAGGLWEVWPDDTLIAKEIPLRKIERYVPDVHKSRNSIHAMPQ
jgi:hypothetical protein